MLHRCPLFYGFLLFGLSLLPSLASAGTAFELELLYQERAPFTVTKGEQVTGHFADPVNRALNAAGIAYRWRRMPPTHQLKSLRANKTAHCAADWYATKERQLFAQISVPIVRDSGYVVVSRQNDTRFATVVNIADLRSKLRLANSREFSFGAELDAIIKTENWPTVDVNGSDLDLLGMVVKQHADYALILEDEIANLLQALGAHGAELRAHPVSGFPAPEFVHLLCSRKVPYALMQALNKALQQNRGTEQAR